MQATLEKEFTQPIDAVIKTQTIERCESLREVLAAKQAMGKDQKFILFIEGETQQKSDAAAAFIGNRCESAEITYSVFRSKDAELPVLLHNATKTKEIKPFVLYYLVNCEPLYADRKEVDLRDKGISLSNLSKEANTHVFII